MPFTIRCNNCKTQYDVAPIEPFTLSCNCGVVIERLKPHYRIKFNHDKLKMIVKRKNAIFNVKLVSIGGAIIVVLLTLIGYASNIFDSNPLAFTHLLNRKPYVHFENEALYIDAFDYSFGKVEVNKSSGDFATLNKKVFDILRDKVGRCKVYIKLKSKDVYGNASESYIMKGTIDINELKKFANADEWSKSVGMEKLLLY